MSLSIIKVINLNFLFLFLPLIYLSNIFNPYEFPKFVFFVGAIFILSLVSLLRFWTGQNDGKRTHFVFKIDTLTKLVFFYGLVVYLADLLGLDPRTSFLGSIFRYQGFITLLAGICLFLVVRYNTYYSYKIYKSYITAILTGAFFVCIFSIWQGIAFNFFHDLSIPTYQGRIVGTIGNPNSLAGYLAIVLPFALFSKNKIVKTVLSLMILTAVIFTDSRSGFLAVGLLFLIYGLRFIFKLNISKIVKGLIIVLAFMGITQLTNFYIHKNTATKQSPAIIERGCPESWPTAYPLKIISDIYNSKVFSTQREALCDNRLLMWAVGLETVSKRPILGFGQENFEIAVPVGRMHPPDNTHNIFLETAISSGLVGLFLFLGIIFTTFKKADFTIRMSLLAFLIVASFNPLSIVEIMLFWFLLGVSQLAD